MNSTQIIDEQLATIDDELKGMANFSKELREACIHLTKEDARFLVKTYYRMQRYRIISMGQIRSKEREESPFIGWCCDVTEKLEKVIQKGLDEYSMNHPVGRWMREIVGIGPVIASGFLAHIDMRHRNRACIYKGNKRICPEDCQDHFVEPVGSITPAKIWRYAGLDPTVRWEKGQKRPWNSELKVLSWKLGESIVKTQNNKDSFYGPLYKERRKYDEEKNENNGYVELAKNQLLRFNYSKDTETRKCYEQGKLSKGHLYAVSKRKIVKLFLSHLWEVWYQVEFGRKPSRPWIFSIKGHDDMHYIAPPNWPMK